MIKKFLNVFKVNKSKLTMEELEICLKILNISMIIFIILTILIGISMILTTICGITLGYVGVVIVIIWTISLAIAFLVVTQVKIYKNWKMQKIMN